VLFDEIALGAGFLFDPDLDAVAVFFGGGGDQLFDLAGVEAAADDAADVVDAVRVEVEAEADAVVGVGVCGCGDAGREVPVADSALYRWNLIRGDNREPVALEDAAVVGDVPVAVDQSFALGWRKVIRGDAE
jgi:hypothetical protein